MLVALLIGFGAGCAMIRVCGGGQPLVDTSPSTNMALQYMKPVSALQAMNLGRWSRPSTPMVKPQYSVPPALASMRQFEFEEEPTFESRVEGGGPTKDTRR